MPLLKSVSSKQSYSVEHVSAVAMGSVAMELEVVEVRHALDRPTTLRVETPRKICYRDMLNVYYGGSDTPVGAYESSRDVQPFETFEIILTPGAYA